MELKDNHSIHGLGLGLIVFTITRKLSLSFLVGGASYLYMKNYGHTNPGLEKIQMDIMQAMDK